MTNRESIIKFFEENGVRSEKNITSLKNVYLIFDIINDEETYTCFAAGFLPFPGEPIISQEDFDSAKSKLLGV